MSAGFFKGTSLEQDSRFPDKQKKLLARMTFPPEYDQKVDLTHVRLDLIKPWISGRVKDILEAEDDVVVDLIFNSLEEKQKLLRQGKSKAEGQLDPRDLQITLTGFLEKSAKPFVTELWQMLSAASKETTGIPPQLLEAKKAELLATRGAQSAIEAARQAAHAAAMRMAMAHLPPGTQPPPTALTDAAAAKDGQGQQRVSRFGPKPSVSARQRSATVAVVSRALLPCMASGIRWSPWLPRVHVSSREPF